MRNRKPWQRSQNGVWYVQIDNKQINLGRNKEAAFAEYHRLMTARGQGQALGDDLLRAVLDAYWTWFKKSHKPSTVEHRGLILKTFAKNIPANLRIRQLKGHHVQKWLDTEYSKCGPTTLNTYIGIVKAALNWAVRQGYADFNPIAKMDKPRARTRQEFVPPGLWPKVLELATDQQFKDFLTVMLSSGARPQEMSQFEASHFDGSKFIFPIEDSKGNRKSRVVYLADDALEIVKRLAKEHPEGKLFRNSRGTAWNRNSIICRFKRFKEKLKMPKLCATTLRHSFAHYRLTSGQDVLTVSTLMGHSDTRMVSIRYGHLGANAAYMQQAANQVSFPKAAVEDESAEDSSSNPVA